MTSLKHDSAIAVRTSLCSLALLVGADMRCYDGEAVVHRGNFQSSDRRKDLSFQEVKSSIGKELKYKGGTTISLALSQHYARLSTWILGSVSCLFRSAWISNLHRQEWNRPRSAIYRLLAQYDSMAADNGTVDIERGFIAGYKDI